MKKLFKVAAAFLAGVVIVNSIYQSELTKTDKYIRNRVLMLKGNNGQCTGVEIKAPSGKIYTLTAGHCSALIVKGKIWATNEKGEEKQVDFISIDPIHDLMLLSAYDNKSIEVAKHVHQHERIHTLTHGHGYPTYRTDGELLNISLVEVGMHINSEEDIKECTGAINRKLVFDITSFSYICLISLEEQNTTAAILPGSSGGPALNSDGELVGIASCSSEGSFISGFVPLKYIHQFLLGM